MNYLMIAYITGVIVLIEAAFMTLPALVALIYGEPSGWYFLITLAAVALAGFLLTRLRPQKRDMYAREGFVITALTWIVISLIGAVPFTLSGQIPAYLDAVFEMASGFTTTGSSIVPNVELLDNCMNFWRCLSHWLGGMGILVFMMAIVNLGGGQSNHLLRAESPGPSVSKMVPNMRRSSAILYGIYMGMTVLLIVLLLLGGMPLFDSLCHAFATAGTGGFGVKAASIGYYDSRYLQTVIAVFMVLFGVNFNAYYFLLVRKWSNAFRNEEVRTYLAIILISSVTIGLNIMDMFSSFGEALHHAFFSVSSIITTTGFATVDFSLWPETSRLILVLLMIIGACAGSTGGGVKVSRMVILFKSAAFEIRKLLHPGSVKVLTMDGKRISRETIQGVQGYMLVYFAITVVSILLVSLDDLDTATTITAVAATLNNIGPGLNMVGPAGNYAMFSPLSKLVLTADMLLGRLELFPLLIMFMPSTWRKH
ncbi:MAG: TrkH family potassium uptake protein [Oscillospiraceae bacterium]|nr:TrkH family potassium uptake protein [Oscillospiraceae bacterium]